MLPTPGHWTYPQRSLLENVVWFLGERLEQVGERWLAVWGGRWRMQHPFPWFSHTATSITGPLQGVVPSFEFIYSHPFSHHPTLLQCINWQSPTSISVEHKWIWKPWEQTNKKYSFSPRKHSCDISIVFSSLMSFSSSQLPWSCYPPIYKYLLQAHILWNREIQLQITPLGANVSSKSETVIHHCLIWTQLDIH